MSVSQNDSGIIRKTKYMKTVAVPKPIARRQKNRQKRVVLIDPDEMFTHNTRVACELLGAKVSILGEKEGIKDIVRHRPTHIILGTSPGNSHNMPIFGKVLSEFKDEMPILGISTGMLAMVLHFGAKLVPCQRPGDAKIVSVTHNGWSKFFEGIPNPFKACLYQRWVPLHHSMKENTFKTSARCEWGDPMIIEGMALPHIIGLAFQPESHSTDHGERFFANFLSL